MNNTNKMPKWRIIIAAICSTLYIVSFFLLYNLHYIIKPQHSGPPDCIKTKFIMNYKKKLDAQGVKDSTIYKEMVDRYEKKLNELFLTGLGGFSELPNDMKTAWLKENKQRLDAQGVKNIVVRQKMIDRAYKNDLYKARFPNETDEEFRSLTPAQRDQKYRDSIVQELFDKKYSPYVTNEKGETKLDPDKGFGIEYDKYNAMTTDGKYKFITGEYEAKKQRELWENRLYMILLISSLCVFILLSNKLERKNSQARNLAIYTIACFSLVLIGSAITFFSDKFYDDERYTVAFLLLSSAIILSLIESFLAKKTKQDYNRYFLIPNWLQNNFKINNEFRKRQLIIFLIYPLFFIVPLPFVGLCFFVCYILPVFFIFVFVWALFWIREGKKIDDKSKIQNNKAQLY